MSTASTTSRSARARADLQETLDAIEDRLNVPKRVGELATKAKASWDLNPVPWLIGAVAAVIVVGGIIAWAASRHD